MVYDILGNFGQNLLSGGFYQAGALNTLIPQQVQAERGSLNNQNAFYQAQNQFAQSDAVKNNPFMQMLTYQMSPKTSPSDMALRGLAYGMANPNDAQGLAQQFIPKQNQFSLTPSNMAMLYAQRHQMENPDATPMESLDYGFQRANAARTPIQVDPVTKEFYNPASMVGNLNPVAQSNAPKQQALTPTPMPLPVGQRNGYIGNQQTGLQEIPVNQPVLTEVPLDLVEQPQSLEKKQIASGLPKAQFYNKIDAFDRADVDPNNRNNRNNRLNRIDEYATKAPNLQEAIDKLVLGETPTGLIPSWEYFGDNIWKDLFGDASLSNERVQELANIGQLELISNEQSLTNAVEYLQGQGAVSNFERESVQKIGASITSQEGRNAFAIALTKLALDNRVEKDKLFDEYVAEAGADNLPAFGFKSFNDFYRNYTKENRPPAAARISSIMGKSMGQLDETGSALFVDNAQKNIIKNIAYDVKGKSKEDILKVRNLDGAILKTDKGFYKVTDGNVLPIKTQGY